MSAALFLRELRAAGITLIINGETLTVHGPREALTNDIRSRLGWYKRELLAILNGEEDGQAGYQRFVVFAGNHELCHLMDERNHERDMTCCGIPVVQDTHNRYQSGRDVPTIHDERPSGYRICYTCQTYTPYRDYEADEEMMRRHEWERSGSCCGCVHGMRHTIHWYWSEQERRFWCRTCYPERVALFIKPLPGFEFLIARDYAQSAS